MILGWIRFADKAACGGVVSEGIADNIRMGQPLAFLGARIACRGGCYIAEGHPTYPDNGRPRSPTTCTRVSAAARFTPR